MKKRLLFLPLIALLYLSLFSFSACFIFDDEVNSNDTSEQPVCEHIEELIPAIPATCEQSGLTEGKKCSICGEILLVQNIIPAAGHTEVIDDAVPETCTTDGKTQGSHCSVCEKTIIQQNIIPAHHTEVIDDAVPETCTTDGKTQGSHCSVCEKTIIQQNIIPAHHTEVIDNAIESTCTATGLSEGAHCSVCQTIIVEQTTTDKKPHNYVNGACVNCGKLKTSDNLAFTLYENDNGNYYGVAIGTCTDEKIVIPKTYNDLPVTKIEDNAFNGIKTITTVIIQEGVTTIGSLAFKDCTELKTLDIPSSVAEIKANAFINCEKIERVNIFDLNDWCNIDFENIHSVPFGYYTGGDLYLNGSVLTELTIPSNLKTIKKYSFAKCTSIQTLIISNDVKSIEDSAFEKCKKIETVTMPDDLRYIRNAVFADCSNLSNITLPQNLYSIGDEAFIRCSSLKTIRIPAVETIGIRAFKDANIIAAYFDWEYWIISETSSFSYEQKISAYKENSADVNARLYLMNYVNYYWKRYVKVTF